MTEITKSHNPRLPPPPAYRDHLERILAKQQGAKRGNRPLLYLSIILFIVGALALALLA